MEVKRQLTQFIEMVTTSRPKFEFICSNPVEAQYDLMLIIAVRLDLTLSRSNLTTTERTNRNEESRSRNQGLMVGNRTIENGGRPRFGYCDRLSSSPCISFGILGFRRYLLHDKGEGENARGGKGRKDEGRGGRMKGGVNGLMVRGNIYCSRRERSRGQNKYEFAEDRGTGYRQ